MKTISNIALLFCISLAGCDSNSPSTTSTTASTPVVGYDTAYVNVPNFKLVPTQGWRVGSNPDTYIHDSGSYGNLTSNAVLLGGSTYKFTWHFSKYMVISLPQLTGSLPTNDGNLILKMDMTSPLSLSGNTTSPDTLIFTAKLLVISTKG
jgi:hypothetical protein